MKFFNLVVTGLFDLVMLPFGGLSPIWALTVVSIVTGIFMLWLFGKVSDQAKITVLRDRIRGNMIGVRLFGDDLGLLARLQGKLLKDNLVYLKHAAIPMVILIIPVLVIVIQLALRYEARPIDLGQSTTIKVKLKDADAVTAGVTLNVPAGVAIETPPVRMPSVGEVAWRIRADEAGLHRLEIRAAGDDTPVVKEFVAGKAWGATSLQRTGAGFVDMLLHPGESPIPSSSPIQSVEIQYAALTLSVFGFGVHWLLFFFVVSLIAGFALRGPLGVEI
jgi:uncharacterized membrane protein (DUF106 family)